MSTARCACVSTFRGALLVLSLARSTSKCVRVCTCLSHLERPHTLHCLLALRGRVVRPPEVPLLSEKLPHDAPAASPEGGGREEDARGEGRGQIACQQT
eukprot:3935806-Rhodomonas_salina.1